MLKLGLTRTSAIPTVPRPSPVCCCNHVCQLMLSRLPYLSSSTFDLVPVYCGRSTRRPSRVGAAALLNDCMLVSNVSQPSLFLIMQTHTITLFPSSSSTESKTNPCGPSPPSEQEYREYNAEGETERGSDEHGGEAAVPLRRLVS